MLNVCRGGEEEITGGRTLQLTFIMRLGLSDNLPVTDDEKNTNSVCVFRVLSALLLCRGMSRGMSKGGSEIRRTRYQSCIKISLSLTGLLVSFLSLGSVTSKRY